ncbi:class I aminotransferase protein [Bifidobacterium margollesii]|uniref:Class I aminotransferase protein n=1 Tax=Bifidobacterium margollesii TaxID=2020964 RepID=A0A2N5JBW6_9BIFI|nr:PLP-dependent aminotransferase family protein [Bifidobacterium margollesii]PLS31695.1 class I aminotransferase protein [Bifidobacterium margollesii]
MTANEYEYSALLGRIPSDELFKGHDMEAPPIRVDLTAGIPDASVLPRDDFREAFDGIMRDPSTGFDALSYSTFAGLESLRGFVAQRRGVSVENVMITNGAMQGVYLAAAAVVNPGDRVLVEDPVFPGGVRILRIAGARVESVPSGPHGVDVDALERRLSSGERYRALYLVPDFQNPTGAVLGAETKHRLVSLADRYGVTLIADNPYRDLWFHDEPAWFPSEAFDGSGPTSLIEIGSFSKTLGPGWRVGWIVASKRTIALLTSLRQSIDAHPSVVSQRIIASLIGRPDWFESLVRAERKVYAVKAGALAAALRSAFGESIVFDEPRGGYFLWARIPGVDFGESDVTRRLASAGVRVLRGEAFGRDGEHRDAIRLSFSHEAAGTLEAGAALLAQALDGLR